MGAAQIAANGSGAEESQTPVRNSDYIAVESRRDLASRHGSIVRIASVNLMQRQRARYCYPLYTFGGGGSKDLDFRGCNALEEFPPKPLNSTSATPGFMGSNRYERS